MAVVDKIGYLITSISNGYQRRLLKVSVIDSKYLLKILECLLEEGYILGYKKGDFGKLDIFLKYKNGLPVIDNIKRMSKISLRISMTSKELIQMFYKGEICVVTTSKGVYTNRQLFLNKMELGGEVLFKIV